MDFFKLIGVLAVITFASAKPQGFLLGGHDDAWQQAMRTHQQHLQAAQNHFSQILTAHGQRGGGVFGSSDETSDESVAVGVVNGGLGNRFGGSGPVLNLVSGYRKSTVLLPNGQYRTTVTRYGPEGTRTTQYDGARDEERDDSDGNGGSSGVESRPSGTPSRGNDGREMKPVVAGANSDEETAGPFDGEVKVFGKSSRRGNPSRW